MELQLRHPNDEQILHVDISSHNNLPFVPFKVINNTPNRSVSLCSCHKNSYLAWQQERSGNFPGSDDDTGKLRVESKVYNKQGPCLLRFNSSSVNLEYRGDMALSSFC